MFCPMFSCGPPRGKIPVLKSIRTHVHMLCDRWEKLKKDGIWWTFGRDANKSVSLLEEIFISDYISSSLACVCNVGVGSFTSRLLFLMPSAPLWRTTSSFLSLWARHTPAEFEFLYPPQRILRIKCNKINFWTLWLWESRWRSVRLFACRELKLYKVI